MFGHSAIRIRDPQARMDRIYNYGTFDFNEPNFLMKFSRGQLKYFLLSYSFPQFMRQYEYENRSVVEQELNLSLADRQAIHAFLRNNERPENRYYRYDFFFDNCATRERDVVEQVLGDRLRYGSEKRDFGNFRDMLAPYLADLDWVEFGIYLVLGTPADGEVDVRASMFLPDYLYEAYEKAEIQTENGSWKPLVRKQQVLFRASPAEIQPGGIGPTLASWLFFLVIAAITVLQWFRRRAFRLLDFLLFFVAGLLGLLIFLLWVATEHGATATNLNVLWLLPTHLLFAFAIPFRRLESLTVRYAQNVLILSGLFLLLNWFLPQNFHPAVYPLCLALTLRLPLYIFRTID